MPEILMLALRLVGFALLLLGGVSSVISAIGFHRFKNFYLRLHAATIGTIWGSVYPLIGLALLALSTEELEAYKWSIAGASFASAIILLILAPAGSHALARAVHRARVSHVQPCIKDALNPELCG